MAGERSGGSGDTAALGSAVRAIASVVAPTTLVTALLFSFGRLHVQGLTRYLRVPFTVFDFSTQDYLVRSADGLFVPLVVVALLAVVTSWVVRLVAGRLSSSARARAVVVLVPVTGVLGLALLAVAVVAAVGPAPVGTVPEVGGLCLSAGVALAAAAMTLRRPGSRRRRPASGTTPAVASVAEWGVVFVLFSAGLFWAVNSYAVGVGTTRGQQIERELVTAPDVVLYSSRDLALQVPAVRRTTCTTPAPESAAFRFRYEGLKLVLQSGGYYLLLPAGWTRADGAALVVPRSDALRLEFSPPGRGVRPPC